MTKHVSVHLLRVCVCVFLVHIYLSTVDEDVQLHRRHIDFCVFSTYDSPVSRHHASESGTTTVNKYLCKVKRYGWNDFFYDVYNLKNKPLLY